jgi:hypothetical protein
VNGLMLMVYNRLQKELSACLFAIRLYNLAYLGPVCFLLGLYNSVLDYIVLVFAFFLLLGSGSLLSYSVFVSVVRVFSVSSQQLLTWRVSNYVCFPLNALAEHLPFSSKKKY